MLIQEIISAMSKIKGNVYIGEGEFDEITFNFNSPVLSDDITEFEIKYKSILPKDYIEFLKFSNGMTFYGSGDFRFFDLEEIKEDMSIFNYNKGVYPIGQFLDDTVLINSDEISRESYIYVGDSCSNDEFYSLNCNFEIFLDRLLITNINNYWRWYDTDSYVELRK